MDKEQMISEIVNYFSSYYDHKGPHSIDHIMRAIHYAQFAFGDLSNDEILFILLHDCGAKKCVEEGRRFEEHPKVSAEEAEIILKKYGYSAKNTDLICEAIENHEFKKEEELDKLKPEIQELLKVQHNGDYIDAIGAIGFIRQAQYSVENKETKEQYLKHCVILHDYYSGFGFNHKLKPVEKIKRDNADKICVHPDMKEFLLELYDIVRDQGNQYYEVVRKIKKISRDTNHKHYQFWSEFSEMIDAELSTII